jgi:zona occludens toxin (predicted ATPase)
MKGQTSLELMVTLGVVIAFTIPVLFLLLSVSSIGYEDTAKAQADATARTLADTMNSVYAQGPGASREILLNVPPSTESVYASAGEAVVNIRVSSGTHEASAPTIARISSSSKTFTKKGGLFKILVRTNGKGEVELLDAVTP